MAPRTRALEAGEARHSLLHTIVELVFVCLPLSVQAITLPALSKAWQKWAQDQRAKERALEQAKDDMWCDDDPQEDDGVMHVVMFDVPLWLAQRQHDLSDAQKRRFQLRAAAHGDVGAVDWLGVGNSPEHQRRMCAAAVSRGDLQALQWLRANGCDWDVNTCSSAARGGHLAVLQWARANGYDGDALTGWAARSYGHPAVLEWARANGCPSVA